MNIQEKIDNNYLHHAPFGDQAERYVKIREAGKAFALAILDANKLDEESDEFKYAFHYIDLAIMMANASIARHEQQ